MSFIYPQELEARIAATCDRLAKSGIKPRDRIAILAPNSVEQIILLFSLWRLKAVACPLNLYQPKAIIKKQMAHINARMLLNERSVKKLVAVKNASSSLFFNHMSSDQPCTILFTSGSSAGPKAALHSVGNYYHNALASNKVLNLKEGDRWLLSLPLYHVGGLSILWRCYLAKAAVVVPQNREEAMRSMARDEITHVSLVPTQLYRLLQRPQKYPSLKCMLVGGAPIPKNLIQQAIKRHWPIYTTYGLTETTSQIATAKQGNGARILPCIRVKISPDAEILVKGKSLFCGYVEGKRVRLPLTKDGWFNTNDLGAIKGRRLIVKGRKDNQFISGGENIQPEEIEQHLITLKGVAQACIVPQTDAEYGERPVAFVKFEASKIPRRKIEDFLKSRVARYKLPDDFYAWPLKTRDDESKMPRKLLQQCIKRDGRKLLRIT